MKIRFFALLFFLGIFFISTTADAVTIAPLRQTAVVDAGKEVIVSLFVINNTEEPFTVTPEVDAFSIDEKTGAAIFGVFDTAKQWLVPVEKELVLLPEEHGQFHFIVRPPADALPGAHYLGLFAKKSAENGQVGLGSRVGSLFFLHIAGDVTESLQKKDFSFTAPVLTRGESAVHIDLENNGNIHVVPQGKIIFQNWRGGVINEVVFNEAGEKILADGRFKRTVDLPPLSFKDIGKVQATLQLQYGVTQQILGGKSSFWYVPVWSVVVCGSVILIVLLAGLYGFLKKKSK
jgi:hypothetical protein